MRERYEDWLDDRLGVLRHKRERDRDMPAAEAKRERKAAKRRRDAELTRLGQQMSRAINEDRPGDYLCACMVYLAIRRGEVQP